MFSFSIMCLVAALIEAIVVGSNAYDVPADPRVKTLHGSLEGFIMATRGGRPQFAFRGIPYAKYPGRFKVSKEHANWGFVMSAKQYSPQCAQMDFFTLSTFSGEEDCLFLNVYTPTLNQSANLPIYFFIHGGGLIAGAGDLYDGRYLLDEDVILVTINYRLGPMGFLTFNTGSEEGIPGNIGLKDQLMALKWVNKNIKFFGGDPAKVTIGGQSSGAASAHYHTISPLSKGLFRAAILESGTAASFWAWNRTPRQKAIAFAKQLGCPTPAEDGDNTDLKSTINCLEALPAEKLCEAQKSFRRWNEHPIMVFSVVVESPGEDSFISESPREVIKLRKYDPVPMMIGFTKDEYTFLAYPLISKKDRLEDVVEHWDQVAPALVVYNVLSQDDTDRINRELKELYFPSFKVEDISNNTLRKLMQDRYFEESTDMVTRLGSRDSIIYPYVFAYEGVHGVLQAVFNLTGHVGVGHCDDLQYLFPGGYVGAPYYSEDTPFKGELEFSKKLIKMWAGFIQNLKPGVWGGYNWKPAVNLDINTPIHYCTIGVELKTFRKNNIARLQSYRKIMGLEI